MRMNGLDAVLLATAIATPGWAQSANLTPRPAGDAGANGGTSATGDIIVTAQRRSESLQRTPVTVSVLSGDLLQKNAITTESDLHTITPGLTIRQAQNSNQINYSLRGQTVDPFSYTRPSVMPYVNEVAIGGAGGSSAFYDLQSIQVLKGPQGTLFGRNATGGAILFTTNKPTETFSGYVSGRLGNYNLREIEGAVSIPLIPGALLTRVAGFYEKRDGFQTNILDGSRAGNVDRFGFRGSVTFKPADGIRNDLVIDYYHAGGNSSYGTIYSLDPAGAVPVIALTNFGNAQQFEQTLSAMAGGASAAGAAAQFAAAHPELDPGGVTSYLQTQRKRGPYKVEYDGPNAYRGRNLELSNITTIDLSENAHIKNVLGYNHIKSANYGDIDGIPWLVDDNGMGGNLNDTHQFSEELQIAGKADERQLTYVAGIFYSSEKIENSTTDRLLGFPLIGPHEETYHSWLKNRTYAVYGQTTYDLSDLTGIRGLGITGGLRYSWERITIQTLPDDVSHFDPPEAQARYVDRQSKAIGNVSWTYGVQEQLNSNTLLYATTRRSYRNGGFNTTERPVPGLGNNGGNGYATETLTDAEIGFKYKGRLGAMPTSFNVAFYQDWIKNSQRTAFAVIGSPSVVTVNVPRARVRGIETETSLSPRSWINFAGSINFTDAKFTRNLVSVNGTTPIPFATYPDTPRWSGTFSSEIYIPVSAANKITVHGDLYAQTSTYFSSSGTVIPGTKFSGYALANFRISLDNDHGWSLAVNLKNAFNHTYYVGGVGLGALFQTNSAIPGDPRTVMVEGRLKF